jgi:hypothetical protein
MKKRRAFEYYIYGICFFFSLIFQNSCARDLSSQSGSKNSTTPEPYVSTGFPQVVIVSGTNYEMGVQYGEQAAAAIYSNTRIFKSRLYKAISGGEATVTEDMRVWDYYLNLYDPTLKDWLNGIAQGCANKGYTVSYLDLIILLQYPTELWSRPTAEYPSGYTGRTVSSEAKASRTTEGGKSYHSCNSLAATGAATPNGKTIHAIVQMAGEEMMNNIILIAIPNTGYSFISNGYAGRVNANSAMNSNGFAWTMTAIVSENPAWGLTEVYFHYLAQIASSRADAVTYLKNTPRGGVAGGFILSDTTGVGAFETAPDNGTNYAQRAPDASGHLVQTNHLVDAGLKAYNPAWQLYSGTVARYNTISQYLIDAGAGSVNVDYVKMMFASDDWYNLGNPAFELGWHTNEPGSPFVSNAHSSVSESIFIPEDLIAYLGTGTPGGNGFPVYATGEYVKIKLSNDPMAITDQADSDALTYYWEAANFFDEEQNVNPAPAYLTTAVIEDVQVKLDKASHAYSVGINRAAFAHFETDTRKRNELYGEALTSFAEAQLYAQMTVTTLESLGAVDDPLPVPAP